MALQPPAPALPMPVPSAAWPHVLDGVTWLPLAAKAGVVLCWVAVAVMLAWLLLRRRDLIDPRIGAMLLACVLAGGGAAASLAWTPLFDARAPGNGLLALVVFLPLLAAAGAASTLARRLAVRRVARPPGREAQPDLSDDGRMPAFLAKMPEALFVVRVSPAGAFEIETATPAFERLFAIPPGAAAGAPLEAILPPAVFATALPAWRAAATRGETVEHEATADFPGGRRYLRTVLVPERCADGRVTRLLGWMRDVTAARRLEQGLAQGARLATVGTLCAGLAHEASQPLNAATLWLRRVRAAARGLPETQRAPLVQAAQVVDDQLRRAGALIEQIRSLAEDDPHGSETFDAAQPVAAAMRLAAARYAAEGIAIALGGGGAPLPVRGSATRLEQAVLQLLANACDAVRERRRGDPAALARVDLHLRRMGRVVAIEVRDSGTGVPDGLAPMIFDPFFTTKDPGRGSGLGLALAASVARAMGGGIETWNLPSGGACFRMELALADPLPARVPGAVAAA